MTSRTVIVFGPTGAVGSAAARSAEELGAKVILAMRDTTKAIPTLDAEKEKNGNFQRVQADLSQPETIREAIEQTGATHAFFYLVHRSPDHMKSTLQALKSAGIRLAVFLSSFTVRGDLKAIPPEEVIPYVHAQVELNARDIFGPDEFLAVRPGSFASNTFQYKKDLEKDAVKVFQPEATLDCIVPADIGAVCGAVLAKGPQDEQRAIYLYGPKLLSQEDVVGILAKTLGKNPRIEPIDEDTAYKAYIEDRGVPPILAKYMVSQAAKKPTGSRQVFGYAVSEEELSNVQKYSGKKPTTFEEWAEMNKSAFAS